MQYFYTHFKEIFSWEKTRVFNIEISNLFLSLLILSINVNGPDFFKTKELFFVLFVGSSLQYGNYKHLLELFIMISVMLISACLNLLIPGSDLTLGGIISNTLGLVYLILLVFNNDLFKEMKKSTFVQSKNTLNLSSCTSNC